MRKLFERIVDFMEENGSIQSEYRDADIPIVDLGQSGICEETAHIVGMYW